MEARELKLVPPERSPERKPRRGAAPALGLLLVAAFLAGTWGGADEARRKLEVREMAERALQTALERSSSDRDVRDALVELRRTLSWRPLESRTRVVYASLVLGLATRVEDMQLAAFHARRAAELSPVTVPVVHAAALVLANTGRSDEALALVRRMFGYDPARAAETLAQIETTALGLRLEDGIPEDADAWVAWARRLRNDGRPDEAFAWLARTRERFPDHLPARVQLASRAFSRRDWETLASLLPPEEPLPQERAAAPLFAWRGHLRLARGDPSGAAADAETALRLQPSYGVRVLAGELFEGLGQVERARRVWSRALLGLPRTGREPQQGALHLRLARLEDRHGRPAAALRHWQAVLDIDPGHAEARRRVDDLSGFQR